MQETWDVSSIPGSGRPGGGNGNPLQYSCLENPTDRRAWRATVHKVAKSWTRLKWLKHASISLLYSQYSIFWNLTEHCPTLIKITQFSYNLKLSSFICVGYKYALAQFPYLGLNHRISDCLPSSFLVLRKNSPSGVCGCCWSIIWYLLGVCFSHSFLCFELESPSYASPGYISQLSTAISTHGQVKSIERWDAAWPGL